MEMKMCDECKSNPANIHLTQIVQNEVSVQHLCEECAKKKGISIVIEESLPALVPEKVEQKEPEKKMDDDKKISCPSCSMTFADFKAKGRLGCASCYEAFDKEIDALLFQVHGATRHKGKVYALYQDCCTKDHLKLLRCELEKAIQNEKFELAAAIRDKINNYTFNSFSEERQE